MTAKDFIDIIKAVKTLSGCRLIYRPNNDKIALPAEFCLHSGSVCGTLKKTAQVKCNIDCVQKLNKKTPGKKYFIKKCHAGILELVVPVYGPGGYEANFMFGPFRPETASFKYNRLFKEYKALPVYDKHAVQAVQKLLLPAAMLAGETPEESVSARNEAQDKITGALELINGRIKTGLKASEAAKACGLSPWYFLHLFKRKTGMSFTNYKKRLRLEKAKELLATTGMKVRGVMEETGYANENIFYMAFNKYTGMTPGVYRKRSVTRQLI